MSLPTPTLLAREPKFPRLLPRPPQPHPMPLSHRRIYEHLNLVRDLQREMDDLSDEENELEDINMAIHNRGYNFLVPIGRSLTQQEEKNDADEDSDDSGSNHTGAPPSAVGDDGENESQQDLDASMEDLDIDVTVLDGEDDDPPEDESSD